MQRNDELMHYGVIGMKWGQRRARKNYEKAKLAKESAREWDQISRHKQSKGNAKGSARATRNAAQDRADAKKYEAKAKRIEDKHIGRAGGKKAYNYTKNQSMGKTLAKSYLMGTYGAHKYNQARAAGDSRLKAAIKGEAYGIANNVTYGGLSVAEPRINSTTRKKRKK